jgi:hypothetical protein
MNGHSISSGDIADALTAMQHQHRGEPKIMIFIWYIMDNFLNLASSISGYEC